MRLPHHDGLETREHPARRLDRIVVGVDFTEPSLAAAQWVGRHLAASAEVVLVHVTPVALMPNVARAGAHRPVIVDGQPSERVRALRGALRGLASLIGGARTAVEVRVGDPATQLAACATSVDADLVVVAGSTKYHVAPRWETATTERLRRCIDRPLLIARGVNAEPKTVLAVVTADDDASPVLTAARMVATPSAARVATFRVTKQLGTGLPEWVQDELRVAHTAQTASRAGVADGEPVRAILDAAGQARAEIIAIGTRAPACDIVHDDGDVVAQMLVRNAGCSVLFVPGFIQVHVPPPRRRAVTGHARRRSPAAPGA